MDSKDTVRLSEINSQPFISVLEYVKGQASGLYIQEKSGEPGAVKQVVFRGLGSPVFSQKDAIHVQPTVYVNGIPIARENNFTYGMQQYDFNRLGPATDNFAGIDLSTIESIEVVKDPLKLALLGPLAANGAIWIRTKPGKGGRREISFSAYTGVATAPSVTPVNAQYENLFRRQFYNRYATPADELSYPTYLNDSTNVNYYGPSNWNQLYYQNQPSYNANLGIRGGSDRANFSFYGGYTNNGAAADDTRFRRYHALFNVNMAPYKWLNMGTVINASRNTRDRNRSLRDRFAEVAYTPNLSVPMSPNRDVYQGYLENYNTVIDDNIVNAGQVLLTLDLYLSKKLMYNTSLSIDYSEGYRNTFFPQPLMEENNFISNYFGFNQRYLYSNKLFWEHEASPDVQLNFAAGSIYQEDLYRYNYARAYDGPNDFVRVNIFNDGNVFTNQWSNREDFRMHSVYFSAAMRYRDLLDVKTLLRYDGASTVQPDNRWLFTPSFAATYHLINGSGRSSQLFDQLDLGLSWARIGKPNFNSRYAIGPNYVSDLAWGSEAGLLSYNGFAVVSRPYSEGWVGYNMDWAYTDHAALDLDANLLHSRMNIRMSAYLKKDQNQVIPVPIPAEYGYSSRLLNGMSVQNRGLDMTVTGQLLQPSAAGLHWTSSVNLNWNRNKLTSLPNGLQELTVGQRKLEVGEAIDRFWLFQNQGIYTNIAEIPVLNGEPMTFDGIPFQPGDPVWVDRNNDFVIDQHDRVLQGNAMPKVVGAFQNNFSYRNFDLSLQFYFALGHQLLNQRAANKYDFINNEGANTLDGIREIFHWQQDIDILKYPIYNPWSAVVPYRVNQDLFLEDASFVKLRAASLAYDFAKRPAFQNRFKTMRKAIVYVSGNNLLTWTKFSGADPELTDFNGYYSGYGLPLAPIYTLGLKLEL
ncbi:SusC/RagA family TonB-linked outer membrane protein [Sphingobacterium griseoflavum]|uniref:SusC/RagA family TonB-linked outer membrane protein n=2 Tax=Sphingobacterium griseoflavum TaxID=1474952 RepID=A0ABQ3HV79_9SPHI|nr:SusC/RagA family TonB-linked outer membrane protein [Sphingobacterium griseoflavum]